MKKIDVILNKSQVSDLVLSWAVGIDTCFRALNVLEEKIDDFPNEHSILILVKQRLSEIQKDINDFDLRNL